MTRPASVPGRGVENGVVGWGSPLSLGGSTDGGSVVVALMPLAGATGVGEASGVGIGLVAGLLGPAPGPAVTGAVGAAGVCGALETDGAVDSGVGVVTGASASTS